VNAEHIALALDARAYRSSTGWWNIRCPICSGDGKLGIKIDERGLGVHCYRGCARAYIVAELERLGLLDQEGDVAVDHQPEDPEQARKRYEEEEAKRQQKIAKARDVWLSSVSADATGQTSTYLRGRGITITIPDTIRLHGMHAPYGLHHLSGERRPSLVGLIEHIEHGAIGVTQTFLAVDGSSKATFEKPRIFTGEVKGGAVRLGPARPDEWLIVGEGIESTMSVMQVTGYPGWAALSACGIKNLILPPEVQKVLICADNDANGVGHRAARAADWRFRREGRRVRIALPPNAGEDFNDILLKGGRCAAR
jgi:putative DNA primase/helicase